MTHAEQVAAQRKTLEEDVQLFDREVRHFSYQLKKASGSEIMPEVFLAVLKVRKQALAFATERLQLFDQQSRMC